MKTATFWDIPPCSLVEVDRCTAVRTYETSVYFNKTKRHRIPQYCYIHTRRRENLKSLKETALGEVVEVVF